MNDAPRYPYELIRTFMISLAFSRVREIHDPLEVPVRTEIKIVEPGFPRVQINMKLSSPTDAQVSFSVEVVGLFDYVGEKQEYDKELNKEFYSEKGLHLVWAYAAQMINIITSQMGMNPILLKVPVVFNPIQEKKQT
jgi:preprotein translocase subunit SecB